MNTLIANYHLHPIIDHFTIALLAIGILADIVGYLLSSLLAYRSHHVRSLADRLSATAPVLLIPGAICAILSRFTGESEAERVWDTISPTAQHILFSDTGLTSFFSHAVLGTYLMYVFVSLAAWRLLVEMWPKFKSTEPAYFMLAMVALCALLYQGKTGGELVYNHGAGTSHAQTLSQQ
jgi:uncharacterized membrane protein